MTKKIKRVMAYLLCAVMIFTSVFIMDGEAAKAEEPGDITFSISGANGSSGTVEYSLDNSNWTTVSDGKSISASTINGASTVYIKATPSAGSKLDESDNKQLLSYGDNNVNLYSSLLNGGVYTLNYNAEKNYSVTISFDRATADTGSGGDGGTTNGSVTFEINGNGIVSYSKDNKSTWSTVNHGTKLTTDDLADGDTVYLKAEANNGNQLEEGDRRQLLMCGGSDTPISCTDLANGIFSFQFDSSTNYTVRINFVNADGGGTTNSGDVSFKIEGTGTVYYSKNDNISWTQISDNTILSASDLTDCNKIYLKAEPGSGDQLDPGELQQRNRYDNSDHAIACSDLSSGTYFFDYVSSKEYSIQIKFEPKGGDGGGTSVASGKYSVTMDIDEELTDFTPFVNIAFLNSANDEIESQDLTSGLSETEIPAGAKKIVVATSRTNLANARLRTSDSEVDLIDDIRRTDDGEAGLVEVPIDASQGYEVYLQFSNKMNVSWSYDAEHAAPDQLVEHARIELLSSNQAGQYLNAGQTDFNLTIGQDYYFELIPDYGYQIIGLNINGYEVVPQESVGVFKFTMSDSNFHFQGVVAPADDKVEKDSTMLNDVEMEGNLATGIKGNMKLSVSDTDIDNAALNVVDGEVLGTVDLGLEQIISKGNGFYWESPLSEISSGVELSFMVPASGLADGQTYTIVREHNGTHDELTAIYNASTQKLTFTTDKFSKYTIVKVEGTPVTDPEPTPEPEKPTNNTGSSSNQQSEEVVVIPQPIGEVGGVAIQNWGDLEKVLDTKEASAPAETKPASNTIAELVQIKLKNNNTTVPSSTFSKLAKSDSSGLHLFTGNGTALTFLNDAKIAGQKTINVACSTKSFTGRKEITFKENAKLNTTVVLHATVPAGTKMVSIYFTDADKKKTLLTTVEPTEAGLLCFIINELGKYELVYN